MYTLGISCYYHDSAACVFQDGKVVAAVEEERFSRIKFDDGFPKHAIDFCLKDAGISPKDLSCVAFYDKSVIKFERLLDNYIAVAPKGLRSFLDIIPKWIHKRLWIKEEIKKQLSGYEGEIIKNQNENPKVTARDLNLGEENSILNWINKSYQATL